MHERDFVEHVATTVSSRSLFWLSHTQRALRRCVVCREDHFICSATASKSTPQAFAANPLLRHEFRASVSLQHIIALEQAYMESAANNGIEDKFAVDLQLDPQTGLLAVFDGHGGVHCASHCSDNLVTAIKGTDSWRQGDLHSALGEAFLALDQQLVDAGMASSCGTTGTVALLRGPKLVVAGVGDSRAVLVTNGRAVQMTVDHKPTEPEEEARIRNAGGFVIRGRVNACLNVSRALGDAQFKSDASRPAHEQQVSPAPDVRDACVSSTSDFLLVCSDGVWNSMRDTSVLRFVARRLKGGMALDKICQQLCAACLEPCRTAFDNITCILCTPTADALALSDDSTTTCASLMELGTPLATTPSSAASLSPPLSPRAFHSPTHPQRTAMVITAAYDADYVALPSQSPVRKVGKPSKDHAQGVVQRSGEQGRQPEGQGVAASAAEGGVDAPKVEGGSSSHSSPLRSAAPPQESPFRTASLSLPPLA